MTVVLDAGAFLAVERGDREVIALLKAELLARRVPRTHGGVVAQIWRGGSGKQASVARLLAATEVVALDDRLGRRAGLLLGRARRDDPIDAGVVLLASDGDTILTSDAGDLRPLAVTAAVHVDIVPI
ncbi:MAG TPA: hypothetical protein VK509_07885 [Polyangiales bacterium]|nr:hypothetical protein [Polyangiales bacterium]